MSNKSIFKRIIDDGNQIFSEDYSFITCHNCESLLPPLNSLRSCPCGKQVMCPKCQKLDNYLCDVCEDYTFEETEPINKL